MVSFSFGYGALQADVKPLKHIHVCEGASLVCMQAISSETGRVIDDFVLKKAANYAPNPTARNNFLASGFQSTYQPSVLEVSRPVLPCFLLISIPTSCIVVMRFAARQPVSW